MFCMRMAHVPRLVPAWDGRFERGSGYSILFSGFCIFGMGPSFRSVFVPSLPPGLSERRDSDSRVSCARACAGGGGRIAPARLVRLIARARGRHRTHLACRLNRGRSAPGRRGREAVRADFAFLGPIIPLFLRMQAPKREILLKFQEQFAGAQAIQVETTLLAESRIVRRRGSAASSPQPRRRICGQTRCGSARGGVTPAAGP